MAGQLPLPTVILPVYNGADVLPACFDSLLRTLPDRASVKVIDDASPEAAIAPLIEGFARNARFEVVMHRNPVNLGFVATVDSAMTESSGDVVLLNSDTVTTQGWLEALARCAASDRTIATATPWSNNAEICSWPEICRAAAIPADVERVASAVRRAATCRYPELPTGVGFCMYIRRTAIDAIGAFDATTFGRGYGEENDFCCRARAHGWRNVLCDDAYVAHVGHASFADTDLAPGGINQQRLEARYPSYARRVAEFIEADPLAELRAAIAREIERSASGPFRDPDADAGAGSGSPRTRPLGAVA